MEDYTLDGIKKTYDLLPYLGDIEFFKYTGKTNIDGGIFITIINLNIQVSTKHLNKFSIRLDPYISNPLISIEIYNILTTDEYRKNNNLNNFQLKFRFRKKPNVKPIEVNSYVREYLGINKFGVKTRGIIF